MSSTRSFRLSGEFSLYKNNLNRNTSWTELVYKYEKSNIDYDSDDDLQDLDIKKNKPLDRKRRDLSSEMTTDDDKTESDSSEETTIEKRSNKDENSASSFDEVSELLEGSENSDDANRRTRQLRPSIISSPWRVSSGASYRAIDFAPSHHNAFGSNLHNFPSSTTGLLFKSDGRFYPTNNFKASDEFNPVISTYSGSNKNKYNSYSSYSGESGERSQEATPKYKQSSKIPSHSSSLYPILFSLDSFETKSKSKTTTPDPSHSQDNYSYFHFGKPQSQQKPDKVKTFAFPVTSLPTTTQRNPFAFNSLGGFFNNNQGFLPLKPVPKSATPAPIYEGAKSASSYDSRYTTASPIKALPSTPYPNNPFLNNLAFNQSPNIYNFNFDQDKRKEDEKVIRITTKKPTFSQYPIPSSTPKYIQSYTTPNQLFDFDEFVAGIREVQRQQNSGKFAGINHNQLKNNQSANINHNVRYQQVFTSPTTSTTASPDDYYYEDDDEEEEDETPAVVDHSLTKYKVQSAKPSINTYNRKPVINSNSANDEEDFYYDDDDDDDEDEEFRPPPIIKPKYTPMSETMAPRPINVTTLRSYYVSGQTFTTPSPPASTTSIIPSIIQFPDDVFQSIRPFTSPAPNLINSHKVKPNKNYDITKPTTTTTTTTERPSTKRTKIKVLTKATTNKLNSQPAASSTTVKPSRQTTRRKIYTIRPNRGNLKFKVSTKRPDLTRLEIDEQLPNR